MSAVVLQPITTGRRIGSLFSGVGAMESGLERAGVGRVVWQVEIDPFCRAVLAKHWPNVKRYEDVRSVGWSTLDPVDVVCGGFPCQGLSQANPHGRGLDDERSGLWREYARILGELRPRAVVIENSPRLVGRGLDVVVGDLEALGYTVEGTRLRASDLGGPHRRERLFVVAYADAPDVREQPRGSGGTGRPGADVAAVDGASGDAPDADAEGQSQQAGAVGEVWRQGASNRRRRDSSSG